MNWHPLTLGLWLLLGLCWLLYASVVWRVLNAIPGWRPSAGDTRQLQRERMMEWAAHQGRWVLRMLALFVVLLVVAISSVWPDHVPGAMCGTGVLQAMGPAGTQTLFYHLAALGVLVVWAAVRRLDATHPRGLLIARHGRLLLLAAPLMALGGVAWFRAVRALAGSPPVNCCAVVYAGAGNAGINSVLHVAGGDAWLGICFAGAVMAVVWGVGMWRQQGGHSRWTLVMAVVLLAWAEWSVMALKVAVTPYIYQVLYHPCLWCLFLPEHGAVGFVYFGLLLWIVIEALQLGAAAITAGWSMELKGAATALTRRSGLRLAVGVALFMAAVLWPILKWRWTTGAWLT